MEIIEAIVLGIIQGITEWLPVSSEGMVTLTMINFFGKPFSQAVVYALWLHMGTMFAAIYYYRKDVKNILTDVTKGTFKPLTKFLFIATIASLIIGGSLYLFGLEILDGASLSATIIIGVLLLVTGILQLVSKRVHTHKKISLKHSYVAGALQGLAILPGISRSGITTATLLMQKYTSDQALRLSFLMSIPLVFASSLALIFFEAVTFSFASVLAILVSFLVGVLTIKVFVNLAKRINFAYFCLGFGAVIILAAVL